MAGSLRLKREPDVWELRIYLGRDSTGRVRHHHETFVGSRRAAERELARLVTQQSDQPVRVPEQEEREWGPATTINVAIAAWRANGWDDLSPKTTRNYEDMWHRFIEGSIGARRISTLGPYEVERYLRQLKDDGMGFSQLRQVRAILHRACKLASKWSGGVLANPVTLAELPAFVGADQPKEVRAPTLDEVQRLLTAATERDPRLGLYLRVIAATGMRRAEAAALRWDDVGAGFVRVDESIVAAVGGALVKSPKTRASVRRIALDTDTSDQLEQWRVSQAELAEGAGESLSETAFMFAPEPPFNAPPHPDAFSSAFGRIRADAGVSDEIHLHSLRHFQATVLDAVVSERQKQARLGWTTSHMARHYTDPVASEDRRAAEHVGSLLGSTTS